jgi:hypothetical protein
LIFYYPVRGMFCCSFQVYCCKFQSPVSCVIRNTICEIVWNKYIGAGPCSSEWEEANLMFLVRILRRLKPFLYYCLYLSLTVTVWKYIRIQTKTVFNSDKV